MGKRSQEKSLLPYSGFRLLRLPPWIVPGTTPFWGHPSETQQSAFSNIVTERWV